MNIFLLTCDICIPLIMVFIGLLFKRNLYTNINRTLDLVLPLTAFFGGLGTDSTSLPAKNNSANTNKKFSLAWSICGICTLLAAIMLLITNKSDIYNASETLLEVECSIFLFLFAVTECILKLKKK